MPLVCHYYVTTLGVAPNPSHHYPPAGSSTCHSPNPSIKVSPLTLDWFFHRTISSTSGTPSSHTHVTFPDASPRHRTRVPPTPSIYQASPNTRAHESREYPRTPNLNVDGSVGRAGFETCASTRKSRSTLGLGVAGGLRLKCDDKGRRASKRA